MPSIDHCRPEHDRRWGSTFKSGTQVVETEEERNVMQFLHDIDIDIKWTLRQRENNDSKL